MSDFDPKAFLAKQAALPSDGENAGFDPKAFLAKTSPAGDLTGRAFREAEEKKLVEGLNPVERALIGVGHGMYNVHQNISDLMGHIPGNAGARVDPEVYRDQEQLYGRTLGPDVVAGVGDLVGQTAPLVAVGGGAGALTRAALPEALSAAAPLLGLGAEGAAQGAVVAGPDNRAQGAMTGLKLALGLGAAGPLLSMAPQALKNVGVGSAQVALGGSRTGISPGAAEEALRSGGVRFGRTAESAAELLRPIKNAASKEKGALTKSLESAGVKADARTLAERLRERAAELAPNTMNPVLPNTYKRAADRLMANAPSGEVGLTQLEALKTDLQKSATYGAQNSKAANEVRKDIASLFRQASEDAIAQASANNPQLAPLAEKFGPAKERLGDLIEASRAAQKAAKPSLAGHITDLGMLASAVPAGFHYGGIKGALAAVPITLAEHALRTRGPSALAAASYGLGSGLEKLGAGMAVPPSVALAPKDSGLLLPSWQQAIAQALRARAQETP